MAKNMNWWTRKLHRWGAVITALPLSVVVVSGLLLQIKKQVAWVQPPTQRGSSQDVVPQQSWKEILEVVKAIPEAGIHDWSDIDRLDVRPARGLVKVRCQNRWEVQLDLRTGAVLSSTYRRSDLIESLHDGSYFGDATKLWVFLPNGLILLGMWFTGAWLWYLPFRIKRRRSA